jgi:hypothetical protein
VLEDACGPTSFEMWCCLANNVFILQKVIVVDYLALKLKIIWVLLTRKKKLDSVLDADHGVWVCVFGHCARLFSLLCIF